MMPKVRKDSGAILLQLFAFLLMCLTSVVCLDSPRVFVSDLVEHAAPYKRAKRQTESSSANSNKMDYKYYTMEWYNGLQSVFWVDIGSVEGHGILPDGYRIAAKKNMSFNFPFYGHGLKAVTISSGGFLYMSPFLHKWLTSTQYIAPLMAGFDTRLGKESNVYFKDFGTKYVVEWRNVRLSGQNSTEGFTFQTILYQNGTIVFVYKSVPIQPMNIDSSSHPIKVGLSDAFYTDVPTANGKKKRTIFEYDKISVNFTSVQNDAVVIFHPKQTCNLATDCETCVMTALNCSWCETVGRCSDGIDRYREDWLEHGCLTSSVTGNCSLLINTTTPITIGSTETIQTTIGSTETSKTTTGSIATTQTKTESTENAASLSSNTSYLGGFSLSSNQRPMDFVTLSLFALTHAYMQMCINE